ncbi:MAG: PilZ domain-containing protein [Phycisphaerae bacterium]|nr:PilZ domain-containing protein [Phycisphaerae bacterium]
MVTSGPSLSRLAAAVGPLTFGIERRAHPRVGFDCPVRWGMEGAGRIGWARDASESGAGFIVRSSEAPEVGQMLELVFKLDNYCEWMVDRKAEVCWSQMVEPGVYHIGVRLHGSQFGRSRFPRV